MKKMKFILLIIIALCTVTGFSQNKKAKKKADKDTHIFRYEIECAGVGTAGTYVVKVWSYSKKPFVAFDQAKKNAVHGILFKGFPASNACRQAQRPIANPGVEQEQAEFFRHFFRDGGEYLKYINASGNSARETIKVGKEYKVSAIISVAKDQLRKDLETAGIIKELSSGF
ncbi:MAG: hypothetical protein FWC34_06330 [Bacteroidetes bacterium]|nr:hypothetical protein [Bacteroidota bacterium]MCL2303346.1 hypothetical protein [Lentimicrobiaceae bacterium]